MTVTGHAAIPTDRAPITAGVLMSKGGTPRVKQGLGFARFVLVVSSLSPVFLLWAIRGTQGMCDIYWIPLCLVLFALPNLFLWFLVRRARASDNVRAFKVKSARDQREHLLVYLFAMLLPLYDANMGGTRDLIAVAAAFVFVTFIFWHLKLHYMNILFAMRGYHIFTCDVQSSSAASERDSPIFTTYAVISKRQRLEDGETISGLRLGGNVVLENSQDDRARV